MNYQRPFDPTLAVIGHDSLRVFFSSSIGQPTGGLDSSVNTYSARSADGINYFFESGSRVDEPVNRVIDPAVVYFNNAWHYLSPIGSPQQGAYHYVSPDGINFSAVPTIPSDNLHNWTGNYMIESNSELRFYGCGSSIWCNSTPNGGQWMGYVNTNVVGGDPSVLKIAGNDYLMIYVGQPYSTSTVDEIPDNSIIQVYPNPVKNMVQIKCPAGSIGTNYFLFDETGKMVLTGKIESECLVVSVGHLKSGIYLFSAGENKLPRLRIMKE
ncbi:MAG: T9SS type A sorting domain-containing protein [Bacteroidota bacterium]